MEYSQELMLLCLDATKVPARGLIALCFDVREDPT